MMIARKRRSVVSPLFEFHFGMATSSLRRGISTTRNEEKSSPISRTFSIRKDRYAGREHKKKRSADNHVFGEKRTGPLFRKKGIEQKRVAYPVSSPCDEGGKRDGYTNGRKERTEGPLRRERERKTEEDPKKGGRSAYLGASATTESEKRGGKRKLHAPLQGEKEEGTSLWRRLCRAGKYAKRDVLPERPGFRR